MDYKLELKAIENELAELYKGKTTDRVRLGQLWARFEKLYALEEASK